VRFIDVWVTAIIVALVVSVTYIALKPVNTELSTQLNSTVQGFVTGTASNTVNRTVKIWRIAFSMATVISLVAVLLWAYSKMQEREVVTEVYYR